MTIALALVLRFLATAAPEGGEPAPLPAPDTQDGEGETLFRAGVAAYDGHDYARAIESFTSAYAMSKAPEILFDLGHSYRALGDCRNAFESFSAFIAVAGEGDPLVPKARARQADLSSCAIAAMIAKGEARGERQGTRPPPLITSPTSSLPATLDGTPAHRGRPTRITGTARGVWCSGATGSAVTLAGLALVFGGAAWSLSGTAETSTVWNSEAQRADSRGRAFGEASTMAFIGAGAAGVAAAVGCWLAAREAQASSR